MWDLAVGAINVSSNKVSRHAHSSSFLFFSFPKLNTPFKWVLNTWQRLNRLFSYYKPAVYVAGNAGWRITKIAAYMVIIHLSTET